MSAVYLFSPANTANFSFQPTLDNESYNVIVTWNLYGQRYYINIYTVSGVLVVSLPLIASISTMTAPISIVAGYFTSTLFYYIDTGVIVVSP